MKVSAIDRFPEHLSGHTEDQAAAGHPGVHVMGIDKDRPEVDEVGLTRQGRGGASWPFKCVAQRSPPNAQRTLAVTIRGSCVKALAKPIAGLAVAKKMEE